MSKLHFYFFRTTYADELDLNEGFRGDLYYDSIGNILVVSESSYVPEDPGVQRFLESWHYEGPNDWQSRR